MDPFSFTKKTRNQNNIIGAISKLPSNYVGSKRRMLLDIWDIVESNNVKCDTVFDAFSGSAMVSMMFKAMGKKVITNDLLTSSAITAVCLLENESMPLTPEELVFLYTNEPKEYGSFVLDNFKDKYFTEKECIFLDKYKSNVFELCGGKFYAGMDILNKATLASIPNSNFSIYGKDLKAIRSTHEVGKSYWTEKWRDTTRRRRDENNEIKFPDAIDEFYHKYKSAFSLFTIENQVNQVCFGGGRYYNGQTLAQVEHRIKEKQKVLNNNNPAIIKIDNYFNNKELKNNGEALVFNSDIFDLLESNILNGGDLIYLDPPYGGSSSDYAGLYRFLEEYLYEDKLENLDHIQKGGKRFSKAKGYLEQFEYLLSLCSNFENILISYNEKSFSDIDTIVDIVKNKTKRKNIIVQNIDITYQYRKDKNEVDVEHFMSGDYYEEGHKHTKRGTEYLILARP